MAFRASRSDIIPLAWAITKQSVDLELIVAEYKHPNLLVGLLNLEGELQVYFIDTCLMSYLAWAREQKPA